MKAQIERIQKDIEYINNCNATPERGITRLTFSVEYQAAVAYVVDELKNIGLGCEILLATVIALAT